MCNELQGLKVTAEKRVKHFCIDRYISPCHVSVLAQYEISRNLMVEYISFMDHYLVVVKELAQQSARTWIFPKVC